jgi:nicotinamidase-related amidase
VRYLLFSECLQNDFVAPMNAGAPLPNELHIGRAESRRLLGDPEGAWTEEGPLARFLSAFVTGAGRDHASVHIRDWHDPEDPATRTHLENFGSHCVRGTRGAEFVVPLAPILSAGGLVVDSEVLSDFVGTTLEQTLRPLLSDPVGAGIIGVWTDFKVQYLAYELQTRLGLRDVAVCSALTASRSRLAHRQALEHMATNLGVTVIDSIPEFLAWLGIEAQAGAPLAAKGTPRPTVELPGGISLDDEERRLVEYLYRECRSVQLRAIGGG